MEAAASPPPPAGDDEARPPPPSAPPEPGPDESYGSTRIRRNDDAAAPPQPPPPPVVAAPLLAIVYSEFDNTLGPTIRCQAPEGFLSQELFDSISDYVITGRQLYGRTVSVTASDLLVVGFPLCIENDKYARNTFLFNVSFVLRAHADPTPYEPILRKLALTLHAMEVESEFLFCADKKAHLGLILGKVLADLNAHNECLLTLDEANLLSLKLTRVVQEPPLVGDHEVPVFLRDAAVLKSLDWDLALRQVIPHIDGIKYAKRLALDAEMDVDCAKAALRTLVYYDFVALIDIFQFSNIYVATEAFFAFARHTALQQECQRFVAKQAAGGEEEEEAQPLLPNVEDVLRLYSACRPETTLAEVLLAHKEKMERIDPRRLVTFGVVYGFLRRVHRYPVYLKGGGGGGGGSNGSGADHGPAPVPPSRASTYSKTPHGGGMQVYPPMIVRQVQAMLDGTRTMDEVCVAFLKPFEELEAIALSGDGGPGEILILYK